MTRRRTATWRTLAAFAVGAVGSIALGAALGVAAILAVLEITAP